MNGKDWPTVRPTTTSCLETCAIPVTRYPDNVERIMKTTCNGSQRRYVTNLKDDM